MQFFLTKTQTPSSRPPHIALSREGENQTTLYELSTFPNYLLLEWR